jgi:hypothetical protein
MFRQPCAFASYKCKGEESGGGQRHESEERRLTARARSTFSLGMFVQVRCMHVSIPMSFWHVLTSSEVRSEVRPPAFLSESSLSIPCTFLLSPAETTHQVISMNSGPSPRIRSMRSRRFCKPYSPRISTSLCPRRQRTERRERTCAVRGGKYSNDHQILSSRSARAIFSLILIVRGVVGSSRVLRVCTTGECPRRV